MRLYSFALLLQSATLLPYLIRARHFHQSPGQVIRKLLNTLVQSAPPAVPAIMLLCGFAAIVRLQKEDMLLLYPEVLKLGADVDCCCFDKTGTLTGTSVGFTLLQYRNV